MTDQPTPLTDEELSAALDDQADASVAARVAASPEAHARSAELAAAAALVANAAVPELPATAVDTLINGALDVPLAPAAPRRESRGPRPWLVAAAVAALAAVGLGLVLSGRGASEDHASRSSGAGNDVAESTTAGDGELDAAPEAFDTASESGSIAGSDTPSTLATVGVLPVVDLGAFADGDALREALATSFPTEAARNTTGSSSRAMPADAAVTRCGDQLKVTLELESDPLNAGYATVADSPVLVYEFAAPSFADGSPTTLVAAVGEAACDQVVLFER